MGGSKRTCESLYPIICWKDLYLMETAGIGALAFQRSFYAWHSAKTAVCLKSGKSKI